MKYKKVFITDKTIGLCKYVNYILHIEYYLNSIGYSGLYSLIDGSNYYFDSIDHLIKNYYPYFFDVIDLIDNNQRYDNFVINQLEDIGYSIHNPLTIDILKNIFDKKIKIKTEIIEKATKLGDILDFDKTLGLFLRGSDYSNAKNLTSFRSQIKIQEFIEKISKIINFYKLEFIFLHTEDQYVLEKIKEAFKNRVHIYTGNELYTVNSDISLFKHGLTSMQIVDLNQLYLRDIIIFSKMKYVMMSITNASVLYNILRNSRAYFSYMIH